MAIAINLKKSTSEHQSIKRYLSVIARFITELKSFIDPFDEGVMQVWKGTPSFFGSDALIDEMEINYKDGIPNTDEMVDKCPSNDKCFFSMRGTTDRFADNGKFSIYAFPVSEKENGHIFVEFDPFIRNRYDASSFYVQIMRALDKMIAETSYCDKMMGGINPQIYKDITRAIYLGYNNEKMFKNDFCHIYTRNLYQMGDISADEKIEEAFYNTLKELQKIGRRRFDLGINKKNYYIFPSELNLKRNTEIL